MSAPTITHESFTETAKLNLVSACDLLSELIVRAHKLGEGDEDHDFALDLTVVLSKLWTARWEVGLLPEASRDEDPKRAKAIVVPCPGGVVVVSPPTQREANHAD